MPKTDEKNWPINLSDFNAIWFKHMVANENDYGE